MIATRRIMATVIPGSSQSNRDRPIWLRRLETVEDCAKVVEFRRTDLSDYVTGAINSDRWRDCCRRFVRCAPVDGMLVALFPSMPRKLPRDTIPTALPSSTMGR
jgi:hypothetical protein